MKGLVGKYYDVVKLVTILLRMVGLVDGVHKKSMDQVIAGANRVVCTEGVFSALLRHSPAFGVAARKAYHELDLARSGTLTVSDFLV